MTDKIRVGLIGISVDEQKSWGTRAHVPALRHLPRYALTAISTSRPETANAAAAHFGVPLAFHDGHNLAAHPDVDLVVISVGTPNHISLVKAAIAAGKHVFCEWPLGGSAEFARTMHLAAEARQLHTLVGLQSYGHETLRYVRDLIEQGYIGRVVSTNWICRQEYFGPVIGHSSHAYLADASRNGDLLRIGTGHTVSAIDCCLGRFREVIAVMATQYDTVLLKDSGQRIPKTAPDQIVVAGVLENGAAASVHMMGGATRTSGTRVEINGTEGDLLLVSRGPANVNRADFELRGGRGGTMDIMPVPACYGLRPEGLAEGSPLALAHLYADFADVLRGIPKQSPNFGVASRIHQLLDAIRKSHDEGVRQELS